MNPLPVGHCCRDAPTSAAEPRSALPLTPESFMRALDTATTRAALDALLPDIQKVQCPFRQRQALLDCWQTKSRSLTPGSATVPVAPSSSPITRHSSLHIEPIEGEPNRFFVESRTNGGIPYLVDMEEFNGNGWCGCKGFLHYIDALELGAAPSPDLQCRHIKAVRKWVESNTTVH